RIKNYLAKNNIAFYIINAVDIAKELGLGNRTNMVMQAAFFNLSKVISMETAVNALNSSIEKAYGKKGQKIVDMNKEAVQAGIHSIVKIDIPAAWADAVDACCGEKDEPAFVKNILRPIAANQGDDLPVSAFVGIEDGTFPSGGTKYEKRGVAAFVPQWLHENCIQCNQCSYVCPHASIRPYLLTDDEAAKAPGQLAVKDANGKELAGYKFRMQVSPFDCQGCGSCVEVCPAKEKALVMRPAEEEKVKEAANWDYLEALPDKHLVGPTNVKNSQFQRPLFEFSGACAGCGETPYAKLITQLYGDRMMIANATGCSSIWGAAVPAMPFTTNAEGKGPAWCNSLFEDNAEFGFGLLLGAKKQREKVAEMIEKH
ncbi:MAG: 4Fe-4S double cluster binding domain-containing protein, partial [Clostridiales bacterium]